MRILMPCLLVLTMVELAVAQEQGDEGDEGEDRIAGAAALGYLATSGNTDSKHVNGSFDLVYTLDMWSHDFDLSAISAENDGESSAEAYGAVYTARRELGEQGYLFTALDWARDRFSAYDQEISESVGYGRHLFDTAAHSLSAELGAGARQAKLRDDTREDEPIVRASLDYAWAISETAQFRQSVVIESGSANTSSEAVSELRARILGNFALVLSYRIKNNSDVLPGTEKTDTFTAISLEYAF